MWATNYIDQLNSGQTIQFRPRGSSMTGKVDSGALCTVKPRQGLSVASGDVVLCKVGRSQFLHLVTATKLKTDEDGIVTGTVQISNNHGHVNGWCNIKAVFGILVSVEP